MVLARAMLPVLTHAITRQQMRCVCRGCGRCAGMATCTQAAHQRGLAMSGRSGEQHDLPARPPRALVRERHERQQPPRLGAAAWTAPGG